MNLVDRMTHRLLADAGICQGMRVLDVGSGHGHVSGMLAGLVGSGGSVLGIDREPAVLAVARQRMSELDCPQVSFAQADLAAPLHHLGTFDAVVGRRVLMYLPDPAAVLRALAGLLEPGGLAVFQEIDASLRTAVPGMPLHEKLFDWTWRTVKAEGADPAIGLKLGALFTQAGIAVEEVRAEGNIQTPGQAYPTETIARAIAERMVAKGIVTRQEIGQEVEGLDERLHAERADGWKTHLGEMVFGIWGRKAK